MTDSKLEGTSVAEAYLALLKARGIDWLFANAGTDFAPIIEALVRGGKAGRAMPEPVVVPHENAAVGMAHGYGCHPSSAVALRRAMTEAAQSRLTRIAGSRDDIQAADLESIRSPEAIQRHLAHLAQEEFAERRFDQIPSRVFDANAAALEWTLDPRTTLFVRGENVFDHDYALAADFSTGGARVFAGFRWSM